MSNTAATTVNTSSSIVTAACQVTNVRPLSANTFQVELQAPEGMALDYTAGHYLKLELDVNDDSQPLSLSYSIANDLDPKHPQRLQLFIQKTSEFVTKVLQKLTEHADNGESINVTLPMGQSFLQTDLNAPHILIAAGSGIAKIRALSEAIAKQNPDANVSIYWSNRDVEDFYLLDEFQALEDQHTNLKFTPILESATANWSGRSGYIYEVLQEDFDSFDGTQAYLCGSPQMVYGTIDQLQPNGFREENCYSDVFEYAPRQQ